MNREAMLKRVQEAEFVLADLNLFLNTHPENQMALEMFRRYQAIHEKAAAEYEALFGPLTAGSADTTQGWGWVQTPWPWEMEA